MWSEFTQGILITSFLQPHAEIICVMQQIFTPKGIIRTLKSVLIVTVIWRSLGVSQWPPCLIKYVGHDIVVMSTGFHLCFHRGSCCPVICVSLFHVIVLSFRFGVLIVSFVWLLGICMIYLWTKHVLPLSIDKIIILSGNRWKAAGFVICVACEAWHKLRVCFVRRHASPLLSSPSVTLPLSRAYLLGYLMQDDQMWCDSTSWHGAVSYTITRSLWPTFWPL